MSTSRIWAVIVRYFYFFMRFDHAADLFFWPTLDLFLWGITSVWIQGNDPAMPNLALSILAGLVFWQLIWRGNYEICVNLLQEFWSRNLVNLFSTPLQLREWIAALLCIGVGKILVSLLFGSAVIAVLYSLNLFVFGFALIPFCFSLLLSGWFLGFLTASFVIYFGQRMQMLAWMTAYAFMPFSAVFYPIDALPYWAQLVSRMLPMSYTFEGMRLMLKTGEFAYSLCIISIALNLVYLAITFSLFHFFFHKSRKKGLARFE